MVFKTKRHNTNTLEREREASAINPFINTPEGSWHHQRAGYLHYSNAPAMFKRPPILVYSCLIRSCFPRSIAYWYQVEMPHTATHRQFRNPHNHRGKWQNASQTHLTTSKCCGLSHSCHKLTSLMITRIMFVETHYSVLKNNWGVI